MCIRKSELRIYNNYGQVTGLVNGQVFEEIPNSVYDMEKEAIVIFSPTDSYYYEVKGTDSGTYGLEINNVIEGKIIIFNAVDIPTTTGQIHRYTIDWNFLSNGEKGVTLQIDYDGDGTFDRTVQAGPALTDITPPQITINVPIDEGEYILNQNILSDWSVLDLESGISSAIGTIEDGEAIDTSLVGTKTFTVDAVDNAGNSATKAISYNVIYDFNGFFQPIDNLPSWNSVKAGSAIPVKFSLSGNQGLDIFTTGYPVSQKISCDSNVPINSIEETSTAGSSSLSYNAIIDQYNYVWKTDKAWANSCRQLQVQLKDGTYHNANFKFLK